jgi:hypothetical protein
MITTFWRSWVLPVLAFLAMGALVLVGDSALHVLAPLLGTAA